MLQTGINFEVVRDLTVSAAVEAGLELNDCTEANAISFTYDALQEQGKVDLIRVISNGACKWNQLDYAINDILMGMCYDCNINRFDAAKNPVAVVEKLSLFVGNVIIAKFGKTFKIFSYEKVTYSNSGNMYIVIHRMSNNSIRRLVTWNS